MSGRSRYRPSAIDGLPCRVSGAWALEKLHYLGGYMYIVNQGMKNHWPIRAYVDLMAGPGRCVLDDGEEFDGSPVRALKCEPGFTTVIAIEADADLRNALRTRTQGYAGVQVLDGECNSAATIAAIRSAVPANALTLAFADMLGLEVEFETLRRLTHGRRIDLAITFQVSDLVRNVPQILNGSVDGTRLDRFFGTARWRDVVALAERGRLSTSAIRDALTNFYISRLGDLGYDHVAPLHTLMKNTRNTPLYRLILAGKHERAADFFQKISKIEFSGQRSLLP